MTDTQQQVDLLVIGGGINGAGIAADAAGRGLRVMLVEKGDLASGTSSWSTKLIHGGLRYLEFYEFGLVRKALLERDVLTQAAPHLIKPIAFNIPQLPTSRPAIMLRAGLFLYDFLAKSSLFRRSRAISFSAPDSPLRSGISKGFEYWDAQVDDSRLVILNAQQAAQKGAEIASYTECVGLEEASNGWRVRLRSTTPGVAADKQIERSVEARAVVNAAGPWVARLLAKLFGEKPPLDTRLVKGSHIIVPKLHTGSQAFMLQHTDGRVIFVIPYLEKYSLIGTTEAEYDGALEKVEISQEEIDYLLAVSNAYFATRLEPRDVVSTYSGVRPLIDEEGKDATKVSRDYHIERHAAEASLLSIYGGKVTTYRTLAEDVMNSLAETFPQMGASWTKHITLPGGDFSSEQALVLKIKSAAPWAEPDLVQRWLQTYGSDTLKLLSGISSQAELGEEFGAGLSAHEVDYMLAAEWARCADDVLWRRTKLGYEFDKLDAKASERLAQYISQQLTSSVPD